MKLDKIILSFLKKEGITKYSLNQITELIESDSHFTGISTQDSVTSKLYNYMATNRIFSHSCYVKYALIKNLKIVDTKYLIIDEYQDLTEVLIDIIKHQKVIKIYAGDANQNIYDFCFASGKVNTTNMEIIELHNSYRCSQNICLEANKTLKILNKYTNNTLLMTPKYKLKEEPKVYKQTPLDKSFLKKFVAEQGKRDIIFRANSSFIDFLLNNLSYLVNTPDLSFNIEFKFDLIEFSSLLGMIYYDKSPISLATKKLKDVEDLSSYFKLNPTDELAYIFRYVEKANMLTLERILTILSRRTENCINITNVYISKGLTLENVYVYDDLVNYTDNNISQMNKLYTAITRASSNLYIGGYIF